MKKTKQILGIAALAAVSTVALASCNKEAGGETNQITPHITVAVTQDTGTTFQAIKTWMDAADSELNFTWDYVVANARDNAANLSSFQNKLLNGTNGIISMVDLDAANLGKLLKDLESYDAYYAGFETELANAKNANLLSNPRIVGSVTDGEGGASRGETLFDEVVKTNNRKIVFAQYSENYFPNVKGAVKAFINKAEEYNKTHEDDFTWYTSDSKNYVNEGTTYKFNFGAKLPAAEYDLWDQAGVDAVVAVNSVAKLILPTTTGKQNPIQLFTVGFDPESKTQLGGEVLKTVSQTPAETLIYPLVKMLNAINGKTYADEPTTAEGKVVTGHYIYLTSQDALTKVSNTILNFSDGKDINKSLIKPADVKKLLAGQEGASHQKLVDILDGWTSSKLFK